MTDKSDYKKAVASCQARPSWCPISRFTEKIIAKQEQRQQFGKAFDRERDELDDLRNRAVMHAIERLDGYTEREKQAAVDKIASWRRATSGYPPLPPPYRWSKKSRLKGSRSRIRATLHNRQAGKCGICGGIMLSHPRDLHIDHIVPLSKGGGNEIGNLQLTHPTCNLIKGNRTQQQAVVLCHKKMSVANFAWSVEKGSSQTSHGHIDSRVHRE